MLLLSSKILSLCTSKAFKLLMLLVYLSLPPSTLCEAKMITIETYNRVCCVQLILKEKIVRNTRVS